MSLIYITVYLYVAVYLLKYPLRNTKESKDESLKLDLNFCNE